jgi:hypothetical protein
MAETVTLVIDGFAPFACDAALVFTCPLQINYVEGVDELLNNTSTGQPAFGGFNNTQNIVTGDILFQVFSKDTGRGIIQPGRSSYRTLLILDELSQSF